MLQTSVMLKSLVVLDLSHNTRDSVANMAIPQWLKISETELVALGPSAMVKISRQNNVVTFLHSNGTETNQTYADFTAAMAAIDDFTAITEAKSSGLPSISTITPSSIAVGTLPQDITLVGVAFDASATIILQNYVTAPLPLATVVISSTVITATVPNTVVAGTYDVIYSDTNGNTDIYVSGLLIF